MRYCKRNAGYEVTVLSFTRENFSFPRSRWDTQMLTGGRYEFPQGPVDAGIFHKKPFLVGIIHQFHVFSEVSYQIA
jgi:hypothetical protein